MWAVVSGRRGGRSLISGGFVELLEEDEISERRCCIKRAQGGDALGVPRPARLLCGPPPHCALRRVFARALPASAAFGLFAAALLLASLRCWSPAAKRRSGAVAGGGGGGGGGGGPRVVPGEEHLDPALLLAVRAPIRALPGSPSSGPQPGVLRRQHRAEFPSSLSSTRAETTSFSSGPAPSARSDRPAPRGPLLAAAAAGRSRSRVGWAVAADLALKRGSRRQVASARLCGHAELFPCGDRHPMFRPRGVARFGSRDSVSSSVGEEAQSMRLRSEEHDLERVLYSKEEIQKRVEELAAQINVDYAKPPFLDATKPPLLIGVLKGAFMFHASLAKLMTVPMEIDFMQTSSYGSSTVSSGTVIMNHDIADDKAIGRDIIIVDDIVDSGLTMQKLCESLIARGARSVRIVSLLDKIARRSPEVHEALQSYFVYKGFQCEDAFVVGYGMDYAEKYRNLPMIGVLRPSIYAEAEV